MATNASTGRRVRATNTTRLPALAAPHAALTVDGGSSISSGGEERRGRHQQSTTGSDEHLEMLARQRGEYHAMLSRKDEQYQDMLGKKDEDMRRKSEQHREDMHKKDTQFAELLHQQREDMRRKEEQFAQLLQQHREDMHKKDQQLERLAQQLGGHSMLTSPTHNPQQQPQTYAVPTPLAVPSATSNSDVSPHQTRLMQQPGRHSSTAPVLPSKTTDELVAAHMQAGGDETKTAKLTAEQLVVQMQDGGHAGENTLLEVLETALELLETLLVSIPRRHRKEVKGQCEKVEIALEGVNGEAVERLASLGSAELVQLCKMLAATQVYRTEVDIEYIDVVNAALEELNKCGDVIAGASRQLTSQRTRVCGLKTLSSLPRLVLKTSIETEVVAAPLVLAVADDKSKTDEERSEALLALFVFGLRNGAAVLNVLISLAEKTCGTVVAETYDGAVQGASMFVNLMVCLRLVEDLATKSGAAVRGPLVQSATVANAVLANASCSKQRYRELLPLLIETATGDDIAQAAGACACLGFPAWCKTAKQCKDTYLHCGPAELIWKVRRQVIEPALPARRWQELAQTMSLESVCLTNLGLASIAYLLYSATIAHDGVWPELTAEAVHMVTINYEAKLSAQEYFSVHMFWPPFYHLNRATRDPAHHAAILPCAEALLWATRNDTSKEKNLAMSSSQASVALLGRNEVGLILDKQTIHYVLDSFHTYFDTDEIAIVSKAPAKRIVPKVRLVVDMVIADAAKPIVLEHPHVLNDLTIALLVEEHNPRRTQDDADVLQSTAACALETLALSETGKISLRAHAGVMEGLRMLKRDAMTDAARQSASAALFELEEAQRKTKGATASARNGSDNDSEGTLEHVMLSYNWDHQNTIKRLNHALKARDYIVWIDIEKMQGSTVEVMSEAVEDSAVMCYAISQAYKESTNCRLEAQYAFQQELDMVPLMMEDGYRPKGWLGMLLGVRLWYGFFGATLESDKAFDAKVGELCRELGERGKVRTGGA